MNKRIQALAEQCNLINGKLAELESYTESIIQSVYNLIGDEKLSNHYLNEEEANDSLDRLKSRIHDYFYE